ncbi:mannosyl-oligosaccharide glucosidase GCS1 [Cucurbita pepo subsp. pepo]|uniref:mannosyl-oligosaccharide glucosidase GCS1 n=1 Tax=Cucurbita pepo subsp. pepo TaxID=3664 RepID=UPI000C9D92D3|nr:mannosyl-oligosaccharide glucosidase GCS1 [Cucurbita pepo subsp. pepo]
MTGHSRRNPRSRIKSSSAVDGDGDGAVRQAPDISRRHRDRNTLRPSIRIFDVNLKVLVGFSFVAFFVILYLIRSLIVVGDHRTPRVITPFPAPKVIDLHQFQGEHKESLYWGTYRPQLYLGIRARTPLSLLAGLMWIGVQNGRYVMRHVCQGSDELSTYGWTHHNARDFGHQVLVDHDMTLTTSFLKTKESGSGYGGDWAVRIEVNSKKSEEAKELLKTGHLFFYLADEDGNALSLSRDAMNIPETSLLASGSRRDIGNWQLHLESRDDVQVHFSGFRTGHFHNLSELVQDNLGAQARKFGRLQLSDTSDDSSNILVFQISGRIPFRTDLAFISGTDFPSSREEERVNSLTGSSLTDRLKEKELEFDTRFEECFGLGNKFDLESTTVGKAAVANLLGGIGYFYGQSKIALPDPSHPESRDSFLYYWPAELYTAVPCRPVFPRGFLWDEGFHQLLIWRWDIHVSLDILGHWLDLMNIDGWIPREQILGAEAVSKVPEEFIPQYPSNANPPALFLVLRELVHGLKKNAFTTTESSEISSFLERAFVRLEAWFQWFNTTQPGKEASSYYWHGRDSSTIRELNPKTLMSGLDDYPRASHPTDDERHVDLRCWMLLAADCMHSISELIVKGKEVGMVYSLAAKTLSDFELLNQMHFDDAHGTYLDFGNHTEKVRLSWKEVMVEQGYTTRQLIREVSGTPRLRMVPHIGYVSLFPLMGRIIPPESWILEKQLDLISNRSVFWTNYGLRSLSKTSSLYMKYNTEHDAPYWRGTIWMNMNYLILSALNHYATEDGPYRERAKDIRDKLRSNLIRNVVGNYHKTGFVWEQYNQKTGKGKGAHPFTGWTSLVLLIMAEAYTES